MPDFPVTLLGGPHDGFCMKWPGHNLIRFGESVYLANATVLPEVMPTVMHYLGEAKEFSIPAPKETSNAG